jgi:hypothetical protein
MLLNGLEPSTTCGGLAKHLENKSLTLAYAALSWFCCLIGLIRTRHIMNRTAV